MTAACTTTAACAARAVRQNHAPAWARHQLQAPYTHVIAISAIATSSAATAAVFIRASVSAPSRTIAGGATYSEPREIAAFRTK